jgi:large subunit ribosomal protein L19
MGLLEDFEKQYAKKPEDVPQCEIGDTVKVHHRIIEGDKERIQIFQGTVIADTGGGIHRSIIVRKVSFSVGVEKTFPLHSPRVAKIEIVRKSVVRRAKLYYLRDRVGKSARLKDRIVSKKDKKVKGGN